MTESRGSPTVHRHFWRPRGPKRVGGTCRRIEECVPAPRAHLVMEGSQPGTVRGRGRGTTPGHVARTQPHRVFPSRRAKAVAGCLEDPGTRRRPGWPGSSLWGHEKGQRSRFRPAVTPGNATPAGLAEPPSQSGGQDGPRPPLPSCPLFNDCHKLLSSFD